MDNENEISKFFLSSENVKDMKTIANDILNMGLDFKLSEKVSQKKMKEHDDLNFLSLEESIDNLPQLLEEFREKVIPYCTNFSSPNFMGFPDSGNSLGGLSGSLLSDLLQQNLINASFCAPVATIMEINVIQWLRKVLGYSTSDVHNIMEVGGIVTYGGTGSNSTAMLLARENKDGNTLELGVRNPRNYKVIVPKGIGHYSIASSLKWLGLGNNIIEVPTENYRYNLKKLREALINHSNEIMAVVAYAGDSRTMTIDNLSEVADLVKTLTPNVWLHCDACHGFSLAFSKKYKDRIKGIEKFDSISTDPHKVLGIPYCISVLLVKTPQSLNLIHSQSDLIMNENMALGQTTPFLGSKSWISLKLWLVAKHLGSEKIGAMVDKRIELTNYLQDLILKSSKLILLNRTDINSVMFMYIGDKHQEVSLSSVQNINNINKSIYDRLKDEGIYYLHQFPIIDNTETIYRGFELCPLRFMSGNPNLTIEELQKMVIEVENLGDRFVGES
ncbi:pyridoxal phosphate-dependent decarboxylase family protein [Streptococcus pneumoniae]|uniref:pyridoxal phosphate-dependent decarboxylase family protein n=1 Tax=Streptococcus pneumoniae TaxID=1313 RepID=UPI0005E1F968|nr:pyridoxal-dependent decarboxylase [Streptococcus pneumoniae]CIU76780.1 pyridoxal-dependent decarboxylase [Streptococcus pneumoniae]